MHILEVQSVKHTATPISQRCVSIPQHTMVPPLVIAFTPSISLQLRCPPPLQYIPNNRAVCLVRSVASNTRVPRPAPPVAAQPITPRAKQLIELQSQNPVFDPHLLNEPLGPIFSQLQAQSPPAFVRSWHVADTASVACCIAIDTIAEDADQAIEKARAYILRLYPGIDRPGGALWPSQRAVACWRDLSAFARVAAYLVICETGLSPRGLHIMQQIYYEMNVPLEAVRTGVHCVCEQLADRAAHNYDSKASRVVRAAFDQLLVYLSAF